MKNMIFKFTAIRMMRKKQGSYIPQKLGFTQIFHPSSESGILSRQESILTEGLWILLVLSYPFSAEDMAAVEAADTAEVVYFPVVDIAHIEAVVEMMVLPF